MPTSIVLNYVAFEPTNVPRPSEKDLENFQLSHGHRWQDLEGEALTSAILQDYGKRWKIQSANQTAHQLTASLYERNIPYGSKAFDELLQEHSLKLSHLDPRSSKRKLSLVQTYWNR